MFKIVIIGEGSYLRHELREVPDEIEEENHATRCLPKGNFEMKIYHMQLTVGKTTPTKNWYGYAYTTGALRDIHWQLQPGQDFTSYP